MHGEVGTKALCGRKSSEGQKPLIGCVGAEGGKGAKGHRQFRVALFFDAFPSSRRKLKKGASRL